MTEIPQLDRVASVLAGLSAATLLEIYRGLLPFDGDMIAAAIAERALEGGGSQPGILATLLVPCAVNQYQPIILPNTLTGGDTPAGMAATGVITNPGQVIAMGGAVVVGAQVQLTTSGTIPSTAGSLALFISGFVTDAIGTNVATISAGGSVDSPVTDTAMTLDLTGTTWTIATGTDLSNDGPNLVSAAGGVYSSQFSGIVGWD